MPDDKRDSLEDRKRRLRAELDRGDSGVEFRRKRLEGVDMTCPKCFAIMKYETEPGIGFEGYVCTCGHRVDIGNFDMSVQVNIPDGEEALPDLAAVRASADRFRKKRKKKVRRKKGKKPVVEAAE